jgi:hypothetical protein
LLAHGSGVWEVQDCGAGIWWGLGSCIISWQKVKREPNPFFYGETPSVIMMLVYLWVQNPITKISPIRPHLLKLLHWGSSLQLMNIRKHINIVVGFTALTEEAWNIHICLELVCTHQWTTRTKTCDGGIPQGTNRLWSWARINNSWQLLSAQ